VLFPIGQGRDVDCGQHLNHDTARDPIVTRRSETNLRILDIARSALDASYLGMDANRALREVAIGYNVSTHLRKKSWTT
jgi:hypothetical protein